MNAAEDSAEHCRRLESSPRLPGTTATTRTKFAAARDDSKTAEPITRLINSPEADMFTTNEADESSLVPVFDRRSFVDDICFGGEDFDSCLATLDRLLSRFEECRISVSFTKSIFVQGRVDFLSHEVSKDGIRPDPKKLDAITKLSFPRTKKGMQSFLVAPCSLLRTCIEGGRDELSCGGERGASTVATAEDLLHSVGGTDNTSLHSLLHLGDESAQAAFTLRPGSQTESRHAAAGFVRDQQQVAAATQRLFLHGPADVEVEELERLVLALVRVAWEGLLHHFPLLASTTLA
ncbi:hypothetical protein ON010_g5541 [Phytophthora cinnamomi]|nr:hypothetical protein ON010_g5541 [Phytophthora cinnamomi]